MRVFYDNQYLLDVNFLMRPLFFGVNKRFLQLGQWFGMNVQSEEIHERKLCCPKSL